MTDWISVDDRLPEDGVVLFFNGEVNPGYFHRWGRDDRGLIIGMENKNYKDRWEWFGEGFVVEPQPTHWMPLPATPKCTHQK